MFFFFFFNLQFRMHDSKNINVYLHCSSHPIIEDCVGIHFTNYELPVSDIEERFKVIKEKKIIYI